jgi:hypothetical protein
MKIQGCYDHLPNVIRHLNSFHALAPLSSKGQSVSCVLNIQPVYWTSNITFAFGVREGKEQGTERGSFYINQAKEFPRGPTFLKWLTRRNEVLSLHSDRWILTKGKIRKRYGGKDPSGCVYSFFQPLSS